MKKLIMFVIIMLNVVVTINAQTYKIYSFQHANSPKLMAFTDYNDLSGKITIKGDTIIHIETKDYVRTINLDLNSYTIDNDILVNSNTYSVLLDKSSGKIYDAKPLLVYRSKSMLDDVNGKTVNVIAITIVNDNQSITTYLMHK